MSDSIKGDQRSDIEEKLDGCEGPTGRCNRGLTEVVVKGKIPAKTDRDGTHKVSEHKNQDCVPPAKRLGRFHHTLLFSLSSS